MLLPWTTLGKEAEVYLEVSHHRRIHTTTNSGPRLYATKHKEHYVMPIALLPSARIRTSVRTHKGKVQGKEIEPLVP